MCRKESQEGSEEQEERAGRGKDNKEVKTDRRKKFRGLRVPLRAHTRTTAASECRRFPHQVEIFPTAPGAMPQSDSW